MNPEVIYTVIVKTGDRYTAERHTLPTGMTTARKQIEDSTRYRPVEIVALIAGDHPVNFGKSLP